MSSIDLVVPDIGNFDAVPIVDVLVKVGDSVEVETPLITLETDKATMDVPSAAAGTITELLVKRGDKVGKGTIIARCCGYRWRCCRPGCNRCACRTSRACPPPSSPLPPAAVAAPRSAPAPAAPRGDTVRMRAPDVSVLSPRRAQSDRSTQVSWCWVRAPVAIPPPSAPPIWV